MADAVTALTAWLTEQVTAAGGTDVPDDALAQERLREAAAIAVAEAGAGGHWVELPFISAGPRGPVHLRVPVDAALLARLGAMS